MKGLILCALLLTGCGGNIIPTDLEAHTPLIWSPVAGVVITCLLYTSPSPRD